jgi:ketose-bisphosphate aldolase
MLTPFTEVVAAARRRGAAAGAFTCYDLETAAAILGTAADLGRAVILLVGVGSLREEFGEAFLAALVTYAERAQARVCVQVDHVDDLDLIARALELGAGAVLADGSRLPLEKNVEFVRQAVVLANGTGAAVEAELGRVDGDEDLAAVTLAGQLTEPEEAAWFAAESGTACLAVSIGNVHGHYQRPPDLDWARLQAISSEVTVPLALHGASGIPDGSIQRAVGLGIAKINVNTELREAYLQATADTIGLVRKSAALVAIHRAQIESVSAIVAAKLHLYDEGAPDE